MKRVVFKVLIVTLVTLMFFQFEVFSSKSAPAQINGELKKWHRVTITFNGPSTGEVEIPNPFLDYRLQVIFKSPSGRVLNVPGYFAADGNAAESGATGGNKWRVHFTPDEEGEWTYVASFRQGSDVAISNDPDGGRPVSFDGAEGKIAIEPTDKAGQDFRGKGMLQYVGKHHLRFAESGDYFIKGGANSPETLLAYKGFDGAVAGKAILHEYGPHLRDWKEGDPVWRGGMGKGIIGALNYLSGKGVNSVYFLVMNVGGDGDNVWPWVNKNDPLRYDCSRLDQWEIVFSHMDRLGIMLHVVTQEMENDGLLDGGKLGRDRKLYYRELVARFGHHLAVTWNLGEENNFSRKNKTADRKAFAAFIRGLDPYDHPIVVHNFPVGKRLLFGPLLGDVNINGPSLQLDFHGNSTHSQTKKWVDRSARAGHPWVVCLDEFGMAIGGVDPDIMDSEHDTERDILYSNLMAQGGGVEWYFRWRGSPENDLNCENWRTRDRVWDLTRYGLEFFLQNLPFWEMQHADELISNRKAYALAKPGEVYAIYFRKGSGGRGRLDLSTECSNHRFKVEWFNPRTGEFEGNSFTVTGGGVTDIGPPPREIKRDWIALARKST